MTCRLCGGPLTDVFRARVLDVDNVRYLDCTRCRLLQTEEPTWLDRAYSNAITDADTGILQRNLVLARIASALIYVFFDRRARFLDFAGGYGIFVRLMRDRGFEFYWDDPHAPNLVARECNAAQLGDARVELVTSFESFEHFVHPFVELDRMLERADAILLSTMLASDPAPPPSWWYYGPEHGQHISFYRVETLRYLAEQRGLHVCTNRRNLHLLSKRKISNIAFNACVAAAYGGVFELARPLARLR